MSTGKVYLIGAGPGDPGLLTLKGADVLGRCDVVLYDALAHPSLLSWMKPGAVARFVGKRAGLYSEPQDAINRALVEEARAGKIVGRLKGGDPLLFARGAEEALYLAAHDVPFEIVPGIASPVAVSAYAGIPLTHRDLASSVLFLTGTAREGTGPSEHDWERLATRTGTLCVLMGLKRLREITSALIAHGRNPDGHAAVIQSGSLPTQRTVVGPLSKIADMAIEAGLTGPALVVIGDVVTLRAKLRWFDNKALFGKRVLVTRSTEQAPALSRILREAGAEPIPIPTIRIEDPSDMQPLAHAVSDIARYDWVALTSANGVERLFAELDRQGKDARALGPAKVAAVGPGTAAALAARGIRADLVPAEHRGEGLAEALLATRKPGDAPMRVLLPRARVAREVFPDAIRAAGGQIDVVTAYETLPGRAEDAERLRELLRAGTIDIITLTSASTVENLMVMLGDEAAALLSGVCLASIGPVTSEAAERLGLEVKVSAESFTLEGMVQALESAFTVHSVDGV